MDALDYEVVFYSAFSNCSTLSFFASFFVMEEVGSSYFPLCKWWLRSLYLVNQRVWKSQSLLQEIAWQRIEDLQPASNAVISRGVTGLKLYMVAPFLKWVLFSNVDRTDLRKGKYSVASPLLTANPVQILENMDFNTQAPSCFEAWHPSQRSFSFFSMRNIMMKSISVIRFSFVDFLFLGSLFRNECMEGKN